MKNHVFIRFLWLILLSTFIVVSCKSSESTVESRQALNDLEAILNSENFKIDVNTVLPFNTAATTQVLNQLMRNTGNTANHISVSGYDITFKNDSISGQLPYYGEQQISSGNYNGRLGIEFNDIPQDFSMTKHKKKDAYIIKFNIDDIENTSENLRIIITLFSNKATSINVTTSYRTSIGYRGQLVDIEE